MTHIEQCTVRNRVLAALPAGEFDGLRSKLHPVTLPSRQILFMPNEPISAVHFVESGMVSVLAVLETGDLLEVGVIGREGVAGLPVVLGTSASPHEAVVQIPGTGLRMRAAALREALDRSAALRRLMFRYAQGFCAQVAQTAACNGRHHPVEKRLARWLLMAHDRSDGDASPLTQEFLSMMLGCRRAGISVAAGILQKRGLIQYARGSVMVRDKAWKRPPASATGPSGSRRSGAGSAGRRAIDVAILPQCTPAYGRLDSDSHSFPSALFTQTEWRCIG
jgi:CRP-like cAMP-binding protein